MSDIPKQIGPFEVRDRLGHGGMGVVYLAYDPMLDRPVAIKVLRVPDEETRRRFLREARLAARVHHPHIVSIYAVGEHESQPYLAMEYVAGSTLSGIIRGGEDVPLAKKVTWLAELCSGLDHVHKHGIVHRDVKPSNMLISRDTGRLRLLDFGIAHGQEAGGMTMAGMVIGTPQYMSPEQITGRPVDARSDIFSVGLVAYELLTGRQAFGGDNLFDISRRVVGEPAPPLLSICQDAPMTLVRLVDKCLEKAPDARYQDARQLERELLSIARRLDPDHTLVAVAPPLAEPTMLTQTPSLGAAQDSSTATATLSARVREAVEAGKVLEAEHLLRDLEQRHGHAPGLSGLRVLVDEARQVAQAIQLAADAERALARANLTEARALIDDIARLAPTWTGLSPLRQQLQARQHERRVAEALDRIHSGLQAGDMDGVEAALRELAALAPTHTELAPLRARYHEHLAALQAAALAGRARTALQQDELDDAAALVAEALAIAPGNAEALAVQEIVGHRRRAHRVARAVQKVQAALDAGQAITARRALEQLMRLDASHPELDALRVRVDRVERGEEADPTTSSGQRGAKPIAPAPAVKAPSAGTGVPASGRPASPVAAERHGSGKPSSAGEATRPPVDVAELEITRTGLPVSDVPPGLDAPAEGSSRWIAVAAGILIVLLLGGGYAMWRPADATTGVTPQPEPDTLLAAGGDVPAAPAADVLPPTDAAEPEAAAAPPPAPEPTATKAAPEDPARAVLRRVQQLANSGRFADAFAALGEARDVPPATVQAEQRRLAESAQQRAAVARRTASDFNAGRSDAFMQGAARQDLAEQHMKAGRLRQAVIEYARAHDAFEQALATRAGGAAKAGPASTTPVAEAAATEVPTPAEAPSAPPGPVIDVLAPYTNENVRQVLAVWREHYEARNLAGLRRVWPTMDADWERRLRGTFGIPGELQWIPQNQRIVRQKEDFAVIATVLNITPLPEGAGSRTANSTLNLAITIAPRGNELVISSMRQR